MKTLKICCISDTHGLHEKIKMPDCDMIIHAGDFTLWGALPEVTSFIDWYACQEAKYKILTCGNHEVLISKQFDVLQRLCDDEGIQLLHNSSTVIEGVSIFGSPYSRKYGNWAYMCDETDLAVMYGSIPATTNILVSHGPAYGKLDFCPNGHVGSTALAAALKKLHHLKLHVVGHVHEGRGTLISNGLLTINAAICGIPYSDTIFNPITVEI